MNYVDHTKTHSTCKCEHKLREGIITLLWLPSLCLPRVYFLCVRYCICRDVSTPLVQHCYVLRLVRHWYVLWHVVRVWLNTFRGRGTRKLEYVAGSADGQKTKEWPGQSITATQKPGSIHHSDPETYRDQVWWNPQNSPLTTPQILGVSARPGRHRADTGPALCVRWQTRSRPGSLTEQVMTWREQVYR